MLLSPNQKATSLDFLVLSELSDKLIFPPEASRGPKSGRCCGGRHHQAKIEIMITDIFKLGYMNRLPGSSTKTADIYAQHARWRSSQIMYLNDPLFKCHCHTCDVELDVSPAYNFAFANFFNKSSYAYVWICFVCQKRMKKGLLKPYLSGYIPNSPNAKFNAFWCEMWGWEDPSSPLNIRPR